MAADLEAEERAVSIMHVCEIRPRKHCRRNVTKVPFFELYRRKTFAAARRSLAIVLSACWLMKVHHSLATCHGSGADMNKRCAVWLPTFLQRGIHFFGERTQVLAFNNFVLFDRVYLPIIGKRAAFSTNLRLSARVGP